jgi:thioredoxin reductase (NADPH)
MDRIYDLIIIGGGPAGLTAGIYASRAGYNVLLIEKIGTGGQMMLTDIIDNYPGFPDGVTGFELQERMTNQALKFGLNIINDEIIKLEKKDNIFLVYSDKNEYRSLSVSISSGSTYKLLGIRGEREFSAKGVSYCGTCDGPFFKDKIVAVIGGGDTALTESIFISKFAKKIILIHRKDKFRAVNDLVKRVNLNPKIEKIFNSSALEIKGDKFVESLVIKNNISGEINEIRLNGVFVFIGTIPNSKFIDLPILDGFNFVKTNFKMETSINGLYACGDIRSDAFRQIVCAVSDGATAANYAGEYINHVKGKEYK